MRLFGRRTLVVFLSASLSAVLLEGVVRLFLPQVLYQTENFYVTDPWTGFRYQPLLDREMTSPDYRVSFRTNSHGCRDREFAQTKALGTCRILSLGDSFGVGHGVQSEETYSKVLEKLLNDTLHGRYEVINAGVGAYNTFQELQFLAHYGFAFSPDIVIVGFYVGNDFENLDSAAAVRVENGNLVKALDSRIRAAGGVGPWLHRVTGPIRGFLGLHSHAYVLLRNVLFERMRRYGIAGTHSGDLEMFEKHPGIEAANKYQWTMDLLFAMRYSCASRAIPMFLLLIPTVFQTSPTALSEKLVMPYGLDTSEYDFGKPQRLIRQALGHDDRVAIIDILDAPDVQNEAGLYHPRDSHWNAAGHRVAAEQLFQHIRKTLTSMN